MSGRVARARRRADGHRREAAELAEVYRELAADALAGVVTKEDRETAHFWEVQAAYATEQAKEPVWPEELKSLEKLAAGHRALEQKLARMVAEYRRRGVSWQRIGWAIGMSDEGARRKYGTKVRPGGGTQT